MQRGEFFLSPVERKLDLGPNNVLTLEMINSLFSLRDMLTRVVVCNARLYLPSFVLATFTKPKHLMPLFVNHQKERGITFWNTLHQFIVRVQQHEDVRTHDILFLGADLVLSPYFHGKEDLVLFYISVLRGFNGRVMHGRKQLMYEGRIYLEKKLEEALLRIEEQKQDTVHLPLPPFSSSTES
jgi:hypothetical protein